MKEKVFFEGSAVKQVFIDLINSIDIESFMISWVNRSIGVEYES